VRHIKPERRVTAQFPRPEPVRPAGGPERLRADRPQLLVTDATGGGREVDRLALANRRRRVEDDDLDLGALGQIARMPGLRRGDPVKIGVPRGRVINRRQPRPPVAIQRAQRHVLAAIDDPPRHRVQIRLCLRHTAVDRLVSAK
jgi:hypothetical protein